MSITKDKIDEVVSRIVRNVDPEKVILFGSYAEGIADKDSDLDIFVIKDMDLPKNKRTREIMKYLRGLKIPVDLIVYQQKEVDEWKDIKHSFISKVLRRGRVLYEQKR